MTKDELLKTARGIVGIDENLNVYAGYDNRLDIAAASSAPPEWADPESWNPMPKEERAALAEHMIALWQRYRDSLN